MANSALHVIQPFPREGIIYPFHYYFFYFSLYTFPVSNIVIPPEQRRKRNNLLLIDRIQRRALGW
jgi:hypothetical protein